MSDFFKDLKKSAILTSVITILLGLFLIIFPEIAPKIVCWIFGAIMLLYGIICIIRFIANRSMPNSLDLVIGLILFAAGLFVVIGANFIISFTAVIFGIFMVLTGIFGIQGAVDSKRLGAKRWWISLLLAIIAVALGVIIVFNPFGAAKAGMIFIGICLLYNGIMMIWSVCSVSYYKKKIKPDVIEIENDSNES